MTIVVIGIAMFVGVPTARDVTSATVGASAVGELSGAAGGGDYGFLARDRVGSPMRYDPCHSVRFVINPTGAPPGAVIEVREAFRRLGEVTGITFGDAGLTDESHIRIGAGTRPSYQPTRYGAGHWAPILVSWAAARDEPILAGNVLGYGGSTSYWTSSSDEAYVTGEIVLDRDESIVRPGFGQGLTRGNLELHELGHVAGLDHVHSQAEIMNPSVTDRSPDGYGPGDLAGLTQLGAAAGCLRTATPA